MNKAKGEMYDWVTHTWNPLLGACCHGCSYCYVKEMVKRFPVLQKRYSGHLRLDRQAMAENLGQNRTIFVCHMTDLFAEKVGGAFIDPILTKCRDWPENTYVFQTKNPAGMLAWKSALPPKSILGTTVETDTDLYQKSNVPSRFSRLVGIGRCPSPRFITIEPIMFFTHDFADQIILCKPDFVNIGADSKKSGLPEPPRYHIAELIRRLRKVGIEVRLKANLSRLYKEVQRHYEPTAQAT